MEQYRSPFSERYASPEMQHIFSLQFKHSTWRRLWVALAEAEHALGLPVTKKQIDEMKAHVDNIDWKCAAKYEKEFQHDVMAHLHAFGDQCPLARPIIHLGATSCYVTDNTDLIQMQAGLQLLLPKLTLVIKQLSDFASRYASLPCLAFTHFQAAQPTTVGKRACLWIQDLLLDLQELDHRQKSIRFLGVKGATGSQASFLELFEGDIVKVQALEDLIAKKMEFKNLFLISGQTYTRKQDSLILNALAGIAISSHKFATDLRLLAHLKEIEEPFEEKQIGSSAMPHKRNPILAERICSLSRYLIAMTENPAYTAATQWLERTLDDSANRRLSLSEAFLCCDAILKLLLQVSKGLIVNTNIIERHLKEELPFLATENILMAAVKKGGDRQTLHANLRKHSLAASQRIKTEGLSNDLLERIAADAAFALSEKEIHHLAQATNYVGCSTDQVHTFLQSEVKTAIRRTL